MKKFHRVFYMWGLLVSVLAIVLVLSAATYAWFSTNQNVASDKASARSGTDSLELQISQTGGSGFQESSETAIVQVNSASQTQLMPVSTADLNTFVYNPVSVNNMASSFQVVDGKSIIIMDGFICGQRQKEMMQGVEWRFIWMRIRKWAEHLLRQIPVSFSMRQGWDLPLTVEVR